MTADSEERKTKPGKPIASAPVVFRKANSAATPIASAFPLAELPSQPGAWIRRRGHTPTGRSQYRRFIVQSVA
jgi:hypothetical protein